MFLYTEIHLLFMKVKDCNIRDEYSTCDVDESAAEIARKMKENKTINHVIVLEDDEPRGVVSIRDIIEKIVADGKNPENVKSSDIMSSPVVVLEEEDDLKEAVSIMTKNNFLSIPVVSSENKMLGVVSIYDVIAKLKESQKE